MDSPQRLTLDESRDRPLDWMPDGKSVVFDSDRSGNTNVYRQELGAAVAERLTHGTSDGLPRVTPDHNWILYTARSPNDPFTAIDRIPVAGGHPVEVLRTPNYLIHRCGLRAECILVEREETGDVVSLLDPLTGKGRELFRRTDVATSGTLSPDGQHIAFVVKQPPARIRIVSIGGVVERDLAVPEAGSLRSLDWSPDGGGFFAVDQSGSENAIMFVPLTGKASVLWRRHGVVWGVPSPDGKHLAMYVEEVLTSVWTLDGLEQQ